MLRNDLPAFADLRRRFINLDDDAPKAEVVQLQSAFTGSGEPAEVLQYLGSFGFVVGNLEDLLAGINGLEGEEELAAFRCREGVAVSHGSDGWWLLFVDGVPT